MNLAQKQLYLPYEEFHRSARVMDPYTNSETSGLISQLLNPSLFPAIIAADVYLCWGKHKDALRDYGNALAKQRIARNPLKKPLIHTPFVLESREYSLPEFVGMPLYHSAQRFQLMKKNKLWYQQWWDEKELYRGTVKGKHNIGFVRT